MSTALLNTLNSILPQDDIGVRADLIDCGQRVEVTLAGRNGGCITMQFYANANPELAETAVRAVQTVAGGYK